MSLPIHVNLHPAVLIHNVEKSTLMQYAHAGPTILEALLAAGLSVLLAPSVLKIKLVLEKNAQILVQAHVVQTQDVKS